MKLKLIVLSITLFLPTLLAGYHWSHRSPAQVPTLTTSEALEKVRASRNESKAYALTSSDLKILKSRGLLKENDQALLQRYVKSGDR